MGYEITKKTTRCGALLRNCRGCEYHYSADYTAAGITHCPECGVERATCGRWPRVGRTRCALHGGNNKVGVVSPSYKGKGFSKYMTARIGLIHDDAAHEISAVEMKDQVDLLWSRIAELLGRVDKRESGQLWRELRAEFSAFQKARRGDPNSQEVRDEINRRLSKIESLITAGHLDTVFWDEILRLSEALRKTRQGEAQRRKLAAEIVTRDQFREFVAQTLTIIKDEVTDINVRNSIYTRIQSLQL